MIAEVRKEPQQQRNIGNGWHTDHSFDEAPALGSMLYAREVPKTAKRRSAAIRKPNPSCHGEMMTMEDTVGLSPMPTSLFCDSGEEFR